MTTGPSRPIMFDLHLSNRFESLAGLLSSRIAARRGDPFQEDVVVVPSAAMRRGLTLWLARAHGVCANVRFVYLAQWLWSIASRVDPILPRGSPFDPESLAWRAFAAFADRDFVAPLPRLRAYLEAGDDLMRFDLATEVAALFSTYATYRNDWLEAWQRGEAALEGGAGEDEDWQAALWRRIALELALPAANPLLAFAARLESGVPLPARALPGGAHVFCLPDIPPLHLRVLRALGARIALHVYALDPCQEYWFDVVDPKRLAMLKARGRRDHHEVGHRLLAAWGKQARSNLGLLVDTLDVETVETGFGAAGESSLLARLQDSILSLTDLEPGTVALAPTDRSVEFHECHSRARELEVLHDRLLSLFVAHPDLRPADVLVVTSDLEAIAPLVSAVFGAVPADRRIPYVVTGLGPTRENPVARALLALLALARSRWNSSDLLACLGQPPVMARFGLDDDALERIRGWIASSGIRWGVGPRHRAALDLPAFSSHSVQDGLERLFLGYALPESVAQPFQGRLPAGGAEGSDAVALGAFAGFAERLGALREGLQAAMSAGQRADLLSAALADFVDAGACVPEELREVESAIKRFGARAAAALGDAPVAAEVVESALQDLLDDPARGGLPSGAVTFAAISSLRGLPYRVVCLVGFDDGVFPATVRPREFDLMQRFPRMGDRQRTADDRSLFLDQILAARQYLHLSCVGRGVRDNAQRPPSVLVAELLDYLAPAIAADPSDPGSRGEARARLVVSHPLQAFAERTFRIDRGPRSFNREFAEALSRRAALREAPERGPDPEVRLQEFDDDLELETAFEPARPFFGAPLPRPRPGEVSLDELLGFFRNPCRILLSRSVGIALPRFERQLLDDEPFVLDRAGARSLSDRLMPRLLEGVDDEALALASAGVEPPPGAFGRSALAHEIDRLRGFARRVRERLAPPLLAPHVVALPLAVGHRRWTLTAGFSDLRAEGLLRWRDADADGFDHLAAWIHQLVLWAAPPPDAAPAVAWLCRDTAIGFERPERSPADLLALLVGLYERGLSEPLYFFPRSAWAFATSGWKRAEAVSKWRVDEWNPWGEGGDSSCRLALRGLPDPMDGEGFSAFETCAREVFEPLLGHLR